MKNTHWGLAVSLLLLCAVVMAPMGFAQDAAEAGDGADNDGFDWGWLGLLGLLGLMPRKPVVDRVESTSYTADRH